jgi:hypothetical protein
MASREFAVGDLVRLSLETPSHHNPQDVYSISRILPAEANVWQYRVRREGDGQERAVSEAQLVRVTPEQPGDRSQKEAQLDLQRIRNANALGRAHAARRADRDRR